MTLQFFETIDSTNTEALRQLDSASAFSDLHKKVIWSRHQTAGRGRMNRPFFSPESGVYISMIYVPASTEGFDPGIFTATAAVAVSRAVKEFYGKETTIKWVNDIYVNGRKVSGILAEGKLDRNGKPGTVVTGIGVNIYTPEEAFPEEFRKRAGSVLSEPDNRNPEDFVKLISEYVFRFYDSPDLLPDLMQEYRNLSNLTGKEVTVTPVISMAEGKYTALVEGISDKAELIVKLPSGERRFLSSGEVSLHSEFS